MIAATVEMLPGGIEIERPPCSSPEHAPDLIARLRGSGRSRLLLLGHVDTVVSHRLHRELEPDGELLVGSGSIDMKSGIVLAAGAMRALAAHPEGYAELALLAVTDEEWRRRPFAHSERFAGWEGCLCFEAGERGPGGEGDAVVVRRKAAGTLRVEAHGLSAHSGSAPDSGRNALLGLSRAAELVKGFHDPGGSERLSAVPTILRSGEAFNVVPDWGELFCDLRADSSQAFDAVLEGLPGEHEGVRLHAELIRLWPGMDTRDATTEVIAGAGELLGRPLYASARGGASDASHVAQAIDVTIDGAGPLGGRAHAPEEYVRRDSLRPRAEVALALLGALCD